MARQTTLIDGVSTEESTENNENETEETEPTIHCDDCGDDVPEDKIEIRDHRTGENYCRSCAENYGTCEHSGILYHFDDLGMCRDCESTFHADHLTYRLGDYYCESCHDDRFTTCDRCECWIVRDESYSDRHGCNTYCEGCYHDDDADESDPSAYADDPKLLDYSTKPDWTFKRTPQCGNDRRHFGIELEMEFSERNFDPIAASINEHLSGYWVMKRDGSIGEGGELVTAPMTIAALKAIQWKKLLASLVQRGARSYEPGTCGLHVHVSHPGEKTVRAMRAFLVSQALWIVPFTKRQRDALSQWAKIPESWDYRWGAVVGDRYVALNDTGPTVEFRLFRGTLDHDRFWASILMAHAITEFCTQISVATCANTTKCATAFNAFLQRDYKTPHLLRYLQTKCPAFDRALRHNVATWGFTSEPPEAESIAVEE